MKKYQISKKLTLQKETVAKLDNFALKSVKGGIWIDPLGDPVLLPAPSRNPGNSCTCM